MKIVCKEKYLRGLDFKGELSDIEQSILSEADEICNKPCKIKGKEVFNNVELIVVDVNGKLHTVFKEDIIEE